MILYCGCMAVASEAIIKRGNKGAPDLKLAMPFPRDGAAKYQDSLYGVGRRVHNPLKKKVGVPLQGRCTICGHVREAR